MQRLSAAVGWKPVGAFGCPVCGVPLDELDIAVADEDYLCPLCGTSQKPHPAHARASGHETTRWLMAGGGGGFRSAI